MALCDSRAVVQPYLADSSADRAQIRREAAAANEVAIADSLALMEDIKIEPPGGPVESITLPDPKGRPVLKGKYHVVVTNDYHLYGRWQTLVRPVDLCCSNLQG